MLKESSFFKTETKIRYEAAKLTDIYLLQETLKKVYGKSPWSYAIFWSELANKKNNVYFKMFKNSSYVGFIGLRIDEVEAHITSLAILPKFQNQGLGKLLLEKAINYSRDKKCLTMSLEVKESNNKAINLYRSTGFFMVGVKEKYYKENQEDAIDMIFVLDE